MRLFNTLKNKVDDLNQHSTDTYELCPHCNKRVHITKCRMPHIDKNEENIINHLKMCHNPLLKSL